MPPDQPSNALFGLAFRAGAGVFAGALVLRYLEGAVDVGFALAFGVIAAVSFPLAEWLSWHTDSRLLQGFIFGLTVGVAMAIGSTLLNLTEMPFEAALIGFAVGGVIAGLIWKSKTMEQYRTD